MSQLTTVRRDDHPSLLEAKGTEDSTTACNMEQFSSGEVVSEGPAATPTESGPKEDLHSSILCYKSKVETRSITFNFNSPAPAVGGKTELDRTERQVQPSSKDASRRDIPDQPARSLAQSVGINGDENSTDLSSRIHPVNRGPQHDDQGDSGFYADDFIMHSGPVPFSGSISLRSDGSLEASPFAPMAVLPVADLLLFQYYKVSGVAVP